MMSSNTQYMYQYNLAQSLHHVLNETYKVILPSLEHSPRSKEETNLHEYLWLHQEY